MLLPEGVLIDGQTGAMSRQTGRYEKHLSDLRGLFVDAASYEARLHAGDPLVYEVVEYRKSDSDLFFGTTTMHPGKVGREYHMTRGHFHARRDMGEIYYTQSGEGLLLLDSRDGRSEVVRMAPGVCAFIPPDWAHRSVNVGRGRLVFVWACNPQAGHDYGQIMSKGMRKIVVEDGGVPRVAANPSYA